MLFHIHNFVFSHHASILYMYMHACGSVLMLVAEFASQYTHTCDYACVYQHVCINTHICRRCISCVGDRITYLCNADTHLQGCNLVGCHRRFSKSPSGISGDRWLAPCRCSESLLQFIWRKIACLKCIILAINIVDRRCRGPFMLSLKCREGLPSSVFIFNKY